MYHNNEKKIWTCIAFSTQKQVSRFELGKFLEPTQKELVHVIGYNERNVKL